MVCGLAEFERARDQVTSSPEMLEQLLFSRGSTPNGAPAAYAHVVDDGPGSPFALAGFALWGVRASTWTGRYSLYLEDLYVRPERRGSGHGTALLEALAQVCLER